MGILLDRLFGQHVSEEKKVGKAADRGRRRTLATFVVFVSTLTVFLLLLLSSMAAAQGSFSPTVPYSCHLIQRGNHQ